MDDKPTKRSTSPKAKSAKASKPPPPAMPHNLIPKEEDLPKYARGKMTIPIDYALVEELASEGMPDWQLANAVGMSAGTWVKYEMKDQQLADAVRRGREQKARDVLKSLKGLSDTHPAAAIFLAKQEHILGFRDERYQTHGGSLEFTVGRRILLPDVVREIDGGDVSDGEIVE